MGIIIFIIGIILGLILSIIINVISKKLGKPETLYIKKFDILIIIICVIITMMCYFKFGINILFFKAVTIGCIFIIVSIIDIKYRIIPDFLSAFIIFSATLFIFVGNSSFYDAILGMLLGGGFLFLLALIPGAIGGGDVKLMFAMGLFLGCNKTLIALFIAFIIAAVYSLVLIFFGKKGCKEYIPFGPFLAVGGFAALML